MNMDISSEFPKQKLWIFVNVQSVNQRLYIKLLKNQNNHLKIEKKSQIFEIVIPNELLKQKLHEFSWMFFSQYFDLISNKTS